MVSGPLQREAWLSNALRAPIPAVTSQSRCLMTSRNFCPWLTAPVVCTHVLYVVTSNATLFIGLDACFKFKSKERGFKDPDLGNGLAYVVSDDAYKEHLSHHAGSQPRTDVSCLCYQAYASLLMPVIGRYLRILPPRCERSPYKELLWVGIYWPGSRVVPTHECPPKRGCRPPTWRTVRNPHRVVKPALIPPFARYINMDYVFVMSVIADILAGVCRLLISYDVACQWIVNLQKRLNSYGPTLCIDLEELSRFRVAIPKFHLVGHGASCQVPFNLMLMDGVGLTHGEGVETIWSHASALQTWSQETGPAACRLSLDDHWAGWNWRKLVNSREFLYINSSSS